MSPEEKIKAEISQNGFITIDKFMEIALYDETAGYYIKKNPIGNDSDFITSPEISVLFGEIIATFIVKQIEDHLSQYDHINLIEIGAGKGTLLNDVLNTLYKFHDIYQKINVHILEISPTLVEIQKNTLKNHINKIKWLGNLDEIASPSPYIYIANEFFDALPVKQFIKEDGELNERIIKLDPNGNFIFASISAAAPQIIQNDLEDYNDDSIIEFSHDSIKYMQKICETILAKKGFAIIIDYGYADFVTGDTLQSLYKHQYNNIFQNIGDADLTAHVNFRMLYNTALTVGIRDIFMQEQGEFLKSMGIVHRAKILSEKMNEKEKIDLFSRVNRLINLSRMGNLFKILIAENF